MKAALRTRAWFGAAFAVLVGVGFGAVLRTYEWEGSVAWISHSFELSTQLERLAGLSKAAEASARELAASYDPAVAVRLAGETQQVQAALANVERLTQDDPIQVSNQKLLRRWISVQDELLRVGAAETGESIKRTREAVAGYDRSGAVAGLSHAMHLMLDRERRLLAERMARQRDLAGATRRLFELACAISFSLVLLAAWRVKADQLKRSGAEEALRARETQYRQVVEAAGDIIYRTERNGRFSYCNETALSSLHWTEDEVIGRSYLKLVRPDKRKEAERFYLRQLARKRKNSYYEFPVIDGHGRERWLGQNVQPLMGRDGIEGFQGIARDITERKKAEAELNRSRAFAERIAATTPGILYVFDLTARRTVYTNREVLAVLGYQPEEIAAAVNQLEGWLHPDDLPAMRAHHEALRVASDGEVRRIEYRARHKEGRWVWLASRDTPFERSPEGPVQQIVGIAQDVTEKRATEDSLTYQANYDSLTGLRNSQHFREQVQAVIRRTTIEQGMSALCLLDVDDFRDTNERYGRASGDAVLEALAQLLREELGSREFCARMGGDEFCFVLPEGDGREAGRVAERVLDRLRTQAFGMEANGSLFSVTATFGIAEWKARMGPGEFLEAASRALSRAKRAGRARVCVDLHTTS